MKKTIGVIGIGRFGLSLVESLVKTNVNVIALDSVSEHLEKAGQFTNYTIICDSTNEEALRESGIGSADHVIVAFGQDIDNNIATSIVTVIRLKSIGIKKITVRVDDESLVETMHLLGADDIIFPLKIASDKIANRVSSDSVIDYFNLTDEFDAYEIALPMGFRSLPITELNTRTKYFINILIIRRDNVDYLPNKDSVLKANDHLIIFGRKKDINKITHLFESNI